MGNLQYEVMDDHSHIDKKRKSEKEKEKKGRKRGKLCLSLSRRGGKPLVGVGGVSIPGFPFLPSFLLSHLPFLRNLSSLIFPAKPSQVKLPCKFPPARCNHLGMHPTSTFHCIWPGWGKEIRVLNIICLSSRPSTVPLLIS